MCRRLLVLFFFWIAGKVEGNFFCQFSARSANFLELGDYDGIPTKDRSQWLSPRPALFMMPQEHAVCKAYPALLSHYLSAKSSWIKVILSSFTKQKLTHYRHIEIKVASKRNQGTTANLAQQRIKFWRKDRRLPFDSKSKPPTIMLAS